MKDELISVGVVGLVLAGVAAEVNLLRLFYREWREGRGVRRAGRRPARGVGRGGRAMVVGVVGGLTALGASSAAAEELEARIEFRPELVQVPAAPASADLTISTDRPGFSDTAGVVPAGHLQLETGYTFTYRNRDGAETQRHNGPEVLARVGVLEDRLEIRFITSGYVWSRTDDGTGGGFSTTEGWSDAVVGVKVKVCDQEGWVPRLAVEAQSTVGTGSRGVSNRDVEPTLKLIWSYDLGEAWGWKGFGVYGNVNLAYPSSGGSRFLQGAASVCGTYAVSETVGVFAEYFVVGPNSKGTDAAHGADVGVSWLLDRRVQLDARVGAGLNQEADNLFAGVGVSFLF